MKRNLNFQKLLNYSDIYTVLSYIFAIQIYAGGD